MNEFTDRQGTNLNRKIFEVEKVEKNEAGEIVRIIGTLLRADDATIEGTPLNAKSLNLMVNKYYVENTKATVSTTISGLQTATFTIDIAEPLEVTINNDFREYFEVIKSPKSNQDKIILELEVKKDPGGSGSIALSFEVILTSKALEVKRGIITYWVHFIQDESEAAD